MKIQFINLMTVVLVAAILTSQAEGAAITWGTPTVINNVSDVSTTGDLVGAFNLGGTGVANTEINGVLFSGVAIGNGTGTVNVGTVATLAVPAGGSRNAVNVFGNPTKSLVYDNMLTPAVFSNSPSGSAHGFNLTLINLNVGQSYLFQIWANDSRSNDNADRKMQVSAGNNVILDYNNINASDGFGQFVIGTFTADAETQLISMLSYPNSTAGAAMINGFQLRAIPVPEPSSLALCCAVSALGMAAIRRRRK